VRDWIAGIDASTGKLVWRKFTIPAPGEPGSETWKGNTNGVADRGGGAVLGLTGTLRSRLPNRRSGAPAIRVPMFDTEPIGRRQSLHQQRPSPTIPDTGKHELVFPVHAPGDMWDYDEVGTHILIDGKHRRAGAQCSSPTSAATASSTPSTASTVSRSWRSPIRRINWTKGIDEKTGKPLDYDPGKDIQTYAGVGNLAAGRPAQEGLPVPI